MGKAKKHIKRPSIIGMVLLILFYTVLPASTVTADACSYSGARAVYGGEHGTELFLGGNYIELGISNWGDFGTLGEKPSNFRGTLNGETTPHLGSNMIGMSADHDGFCNGRDLPVDYYLPGTPEERFAVGYQIGSTKNANSNSAQMGTRNMPTTVTNESNVEQGILKARTVSIWAGTMEITQVISFRVDDKFYRNDVTIKNITAHAWDGARYMRTFDPDNSQYRGGPFVTANTVTHTIAEDGKSVIKAETFQNHDPLYTAFNSRIPIFFYSNDPAARASVFGFTNTNPYEPAAYDNPSAKGQTIQADQAITMTWDSGPLHAGESKTFTYYTSLDERDFDDVQKEIFIDDVKKDIENLDDMDDVKKVKDKIDNEDSLEEEKKKELKSDVLDILIDGEKDILIRDARDIFVVRDLINESDKDDEEKDDIRKKYVKKILDDLEELSPEEEEATRAIIDDIVDPTKKAEAEDTLNSLADLIAAAEEALEEAEKTQDRYKDTGGDASDELYEEVAAAKEALNEALLADPADKDAIESATEALHDATKKLEEAAEQKELANAKAAGEEALEEAEKTQERYKNAGGDASDDIFEQLETAKEALNEALLADPADKDAIESATEALNDATKKLEEAAEQKELENAKAAGEEALEEAEKAQDRYKNAGGDATDEIYEALEAAKEVLEAAKLADPANKEAIEAATEEVTDLTTVLEKAIDAKELENAKFAGEKALEEAEKAQDRYENAGGETSDDLYEAVEAAKEALKEVLLADPAEKDAIEAATEALIDETKKLEEAVEAKELANAKAAGEEALEKTEKAQDRYYNAGGEESDELYEAVEAAKEVLNNALQATPAEKEAIEAATEALNDATKKLEEAAEAKELANAKAAGEEALQEATKAKDRYYNAGGEESDELYEVVEAAKEVLNNALQATPVEKDAIEAATEALNDATKKLEEAAEQKELENAKAAGEDALDEAEKAHDRYKKSGGEASDELYEAVEEAKNTLQEALHQDPLNKETIEEATALLEAAILELNMETTTKDLETDITNVDSIDQLLEVKQKIDSSDISEDRKAHLYTNLVNKWLETKTSFSFVDEDQVQQLVDAVEQSDKEETEKQQAYIALIENAIDDVAKHDKPVNAETKFQQPENKVIELAIQNVTSDEEKQRLTTLLELTVDARALSMQTAFTFAEGDTWESITSKFIMLAEGNYGSNITWESSKNDIITVSGENAEVQRQTRDESVILTATLTNGVAQLEKTFLLVVKSNRVGDKLFEEVKREVTVEVGSNLNKPPAIQRINLLDSSNTTIVNKIDKLIIDNAIISQVTSGPITIYLPDDTSNLADEIAVEISLDVLEKIQDSLTIKTDQGSIILSKETIEKMQQDGKDLFFRIVPVRQTDERNDVIERTKNHELVIAELEAGQEIVVLGTPREIETNYKGYETTVILPLDDVEYTNIDNLRIFIEHTDGDRRVVNGEVVVDENGTPVGLQFVIDKFSTFTIFEIVQSEEVDTPGEGTPPVEDNESPGSETTPGSGSETPGLEPTPGSGSESPVTDTTPGIGSDATVENDSAGSEGKGGENKTGEKAAGADALTDAVAADTDNLPSTATNNYNMLLLGTVLTIMGVISLYYRKKRTA
ncbi:immunoglobulin-like domain-containing protein [Evansella cellulosilytica]|uniref:LPXTG-motif cell wall anchor domain protein n=1 Tax=Evansella cellulosilytica (strain ATCC 21833 / DSM 2522 / FERM P-1141 / JCM 9156 / N-4) TaxID=649639 RepID=E6TWG3_EVAC2|nr:immunoglobulin-like domain-containing protein [Evansella cellulosilytica]ADU32226.1 LPXTG-motif cell wall anchor domain protein [Evansella cellulosilytica DSM 2522]